MKYLISERDPETGKMQDVRIGDRLIGTIKVQHNPLLDGPIENYINSPRFIVFDENGKEVNAKEQSEA